MYVYPRIHPVNHQTNIQLLHYSTNHCSWHSERPRSPTSSNAQGQSYNPKTVTSFPFFSKHQNWQKAVSPPPSPICRSGSAPLYKHWKCCFTTILEEPIIITVLLLGFDKRGPKGPSGWKRRPQDYPSPPPHPSIKNAAIQSYRINKDKLVCICMH